MLMVCPSGVMDGGVGLQAMSTNAYAPDGEGGKPLGYLFTDIEDSTPKWENTPEAMALALARHNHLLDEIIAVNGGVIQDHAGDGVFAIFPAGNPVQCALDLQFALQAMDWESVGGLLVRVGVHCGAAGIRTIDKRATNRASRIAASAWGGQIVISAAAAAAFGAVVACEQIDLGNCTLRGITQPMRLFGLAHPRLARNEFPPLRTLLSRGQAAPTPAAPMHGRDEEMKEIVSKLAVSRYMTIVGPGGNGKTRLALEIALERSERQAAYFVSLEGVADDAQFIAVLANTMRLPLHGRMAPEDQVINYLRDKDALLVLDNADRLAGRTRLPARILAACDQVQILVTSREPMSIEGEIAYRLRGLRPPRPTDPDFRATPACRLFLQEVHAVNPSFAMADGEAGVFGAICGVVGGSPLALRLTAQWTPLLTLDEILARLRSGVNFLGELGDTQGSQLAWVFDRSWELLNADQQLALARLSVFKDGFDRQAAEDVAGARLPTVAALERKCLIEQQQPHRFLLHPLIYEYARRKLDLVSEADAGETRLRHARYFCDRVERCYRDARGARQGRMLDLIEQELANLSVAWAHLLQTGALRQARASAEAIFYSLSHRSLFHDCSLMFDVETGDGEMDDYLRSLRANCLFHQGDFQTAESLARRALRCAGADTPTAAHCHHVLGCIAHARGEIVPAASHYERALKQREHLHDLIGSYYSSMALAWVELLRDNVEGARDRVRQARKLCRRAGHRGGMLAVHLCAGDIAVRENRLHDAEASYRQALGVEDDVRHPQHRAAALVRLGAVRIRRNDLTLALDALEESLELAELIGDVRIIVNGRLELARLLRCTGDLGRAKTELLRALGQARDLTSDHQVVAVLIELARVSIAAGDVGAALRIAGVLRAGDLDSVKEEWRALLRELPRTEPSAGEALEEVLSELIDESEFGVLRL
jgi:class 3 adenylate cyclase/tetratricopeptide (TPR) repeat protein